MGKISCEIETYVSLKDEMNTTLKDIFFDLTMFQQKIEKTFNKQLNDNLQGTYYIEIGEDETNKLEE
jgi:hypothetical protein